MAEVKWNGAELSARIQRASLQAVNEITAEAAGEARQDHWWHSHTGQRLEHETIATPAEITPEGVAGRFGTTRRRGFYGLFLEYERPFLRPVADRVFPQLADRIRDKL